MKVLEWFKRPTLFVRKKPKADTVVSQLQELRALRKRKLPARRKK